MEVHATLHLQKQWQLEKGSQKGKTFLIQKICHAEGYKIIDCSILEQVFNDVCKCPFCGTDGAITLNQNNKKRKGLCEKLIIMCNSCQNIIKEFETSPTVTDVGKKEWST